MNNRQAVLVTGAAKRLGRAIALRFAAEGWDVAAHYNGSEDAAQSLRSEVEALGVTCTLFKANVGERAACLQLVADASAAYPRLAGLVNSASVFEPDDMAGMTEEFYRWQMAVNAEAPLFLTQAFHGAITGKGWVLNMVDCKIDVLTPDFFAYTLSKLALQNVTDMMAMACAPKLRVNGIAPGLVLRSGNQTDETFEREHDQIPLRVGPTAEHIVDWAWMLANSPSVTGQIIRVDGGRHMYTPASLSAQFEVPALESEA